MKKRVKKIVKRVMAAAKAKERGAESEVTLRLDEVEDDINSKLTLIHRAIQRVALKSEAGTVVDIGAVIDSLRQDAQRLLAAVRVSHAHGD